MLDFLNRENLLATYRVHTLYLPYVFQDHDTQTKQYEEAGLTARDIVKTLKL